MTNIVPFQFESTQVRAISDAQGDHWFVLRELLDAMQSTTTTTAAVESINQGLGDGYVNDIPILDNLGREQQAIIVAESGATYLLSRSNTETGRRLNRFIHADVLPTLRKTGRYEAPQAQPALPPTVPVRPRNHTVLHPVPFNGQTLSLVVHNGEPYVDMRVLVAAIGLNWGGQMDKLMHSYNRSVKGITPRMVGEAIPRQMICLPLRKLDLWLDKLKPARVRPTVRERLGIYKTECDDALWAFWTQLQAAAVAAPALPAHAPYRARLPDPTGGGQH
jgi:prophage antirepressor-like protein